MNKGIAIVCLLASVNAYAQWGDSRPQQGAGTTYYKNVNGSVVGSAETYGNGTTNYKDVNGSVVGSSTSYPTYQPRPITSDAEKAQASRDVDDMFRTILGK